MARKKKLLDEGKGETKEAPAVGTAETSGADVTIQADNSTKGENCQAATTAETATTEPGNDMASWDTGDTDGTFTDDARGRHFGAIVYPSEAWIRKNCPDCKYDGRDGWGTAPDDWREQLAATGLAFVVSPLHYLDTYLDAGTGKPIVKKPHWHIIVSWNNSTTYRSAGQTLAVTKGPRPIILRQVVGYYRYFNHRDNPEKYQYTDAPVPHNGWERPLDNEEVSRILGELMVAVIEQDCEEYGELMIEAWAMGPEYKQVAERQTVYLGAICRSYRNAPMRVISRYVARMPGVSRETASRLLKLAKTKDRQLKQARKERGRSESCDT